MRVRFLILGLLILVLAISLNYKKLYAFTKFEEETKVEATTKLEDPNEENYVKIEYMVTETSGKEIYAKAINSDAKIFFTTEQLEIPLSENLMTNDRILAFFDRTNARDGLIKVEKVK